MFYTTKDKDKVDYLYHTNEFLTLEIKNLTRRLEIQTTRIDALLKVYPYGANSDGSPRQKPGRKSKVTA